MEDVRSIDTEDMDDVEFGGSERRKGVHGEEEDEEKRSKSRPPKTADKQGTSEMVTRLVVSLSVSLARAVLHAPTDKLLSKAADSQLLPKQLKEKASEAAEKKLDFADIVESIMEASNQMLKKRGLSRPEFEMTTEAFSVFLRLATEFTGPLEGVDPAHVYDAIKAYYHIQRITRLSEAEKAVVARKRESRLRFKTDGRIPQKDAEELAKYCRFAMACYGNRGMKFLGILWEDDESKWSDIHARALEYLTGCDPERDLVQCSWRSNWTGSIYRPGYYVLLDHSSKELIVAIRGSYRAQDVITDLMCEDTDFDFHYHPKEDLKHAQRELEEVFRSLSSAISGLDESVSNARVGELESTVRETTTNIYEQLQSWVAKQSEVIAKQMEAEGDLSPEEDGRREEADREEDGPDADVDPRKDVLDTQLRRNMSKAKHIKYKPKEASKGHRQMNGRVHFGFLKSAQALANELEDTVVTTMVKHKGYKLVLVGHSLGAAVATLLTFMWAKHKQLKSARCYVYAPPCSLSLNLAESAFALSRIKGVVLADDLVPRLSLGSVSDMRSAAIYCATEKFQVDENSRTVADYVNETVKSGLSDQELGEAFAPLMQTIRSEYMRHSKLYPAGVLYHIETDQGKLPDAFRKRATDFDELVISRGMFHPHLPQRYAHACCTKLHLSALDAEKERKEEKKHAKNNKRLSFFKSKKG